MPKWIRSAYVLLQQHRLQGGAVYVHGDVSSCNSGMGYAALADIHCLCVWLQRYNLSCFLLPPSHRLLLPSLNRSATRCGKSNNVESATLRVLSYFSSSDSRVTHGRHGELDGKGSLHYV